jgi:hypothetical protein
LGLIVGVLTVVALIGLSHSAAGWVDTFESRLAILAIPPT